MQRDPSRKANHFLDAPLKDAIMSLNVFLAGSKEKEGGIMEKPAGVLTRGEMNTRGR